jgi:hypothetical protein
MGHFSGNESQQLQNITATSLIVGMVNCNRPPRFAAPVVIADEATCSPYVPHSRAGRQT